MQEFFSMPLYSSACFLPSQKWRLRLSPAADESSCATLAVFPPGLTSSALKPWRHGTSHYATGDVGCPVGSSLGQRICVYLPRQATLHNAINSHDPTSDFPPINRQVASTGSWSTPPSCLLSQPWEAEPQEQILRPVQSADTRLQPCWPNVLSCSGLSGAGNSSFSQLGAEVPFKSPVKPGIVLQVRSFKPDGPLVLTLQPVVSGWLDRKSHILSPESVLHQKFDSLSLSSSWKI